MARGRDRGLRGPDDVEYAMSSDLPAAIEDEITCGRRDDPDNTIEYTPVERNEGLLVGLTDEQLDALEDTDEVRVERARRREELAATPADLLKFFTRREAGYWPRKDRSKYIPHVGAQELLRRETGFSRADAKEAVRRFHAERKEQTSGEA
jgi:hypothetical protein